MFRKDFLRAIAVLGLALAVLVACRSPSGPGQEPENEQETGNDPVEVTVRIVPATGIDGTFLGMGEYRVFQLDVNPPDTAIQTVRWTTGNPAVLEIQAYPITDAEPATRISSGSIRAYGKSPGAATLATIVTVAGGEEITASEDIEVAIIRTVTLNFYYGRSPVAISVRYGETVDLPTPTRADYRFDGWFTDPAATNAFDTTTTIYNDTILYAGWTMRLTITFDSQGGSVVEPVYVWEGETATAPVAPFRSFKGLFQAPLPQNFDFAAGWSFIGWHLDDTVFDFTTPLTTGITLKAVWETQVHPIDLSAVAGDTIIHQAFAYLNSTPAGTEYILVLNDDTTVGGGALELSDGISLALRGIGGELEICLSSPGFLFAVSNDAKLALDEGIALRGIESNNATVVDVRSHGTLIMRAGSAIRGNVNTGSGGGVFVGANGIFVMEGGEISGNNANAGWFGGGGVFVASNGTFLMEGGVIDSNTSNLGGGGVFVTANGTFVMEDGKISGNTLRSGGNAGGGVRVETNGTFTMKGGEIFGNTSITSGGVHTNGTFTMEGGKILGNIGEGVRVSSDSGTFFMEGGKISSNNGGVAVLSGGTFVMESGVIYNNPVGVHIFNGAFTMEDGIISGNGPGWFGGGVSVNGTDGIFVMKGGVISDNTASQTGGGVSVSDGTFVMEDGEIFGNTTFYGGGGGVAVLWDGTFTMKGGVIFDNTSNNWGGGGVFVMGAFQIITGVVYGSDAEDGLANTAPWRGSTLYLQGGTAHRGRLNGTFVSSGNLIAPSDLIANEATNDTIRVLDGEFVTP